MLIKPKLTCGLKVSQLKKCWLNQNKNTKYIISKTKTNSDQLLIMHDSVI